MVIMQFSVFSNILNETIFEKSKADLLEKISNSPSRYIGLFRPSKPKAKILQNLLQSHEIRFGDAFEKLIEKYLELKGCKILNKIFVTNDKESLNIDQFFKKGRKFYFIEQKVRDDHDSTKKRGQIQNFEKKLNELIKIYKEKSLVGIFYFIDPELTKNKTYYATEINKISKDYGVELKLFYGKPLFDYLSYNDVWKEMIDYLEKWKKSIPELPEINFDLDAKHTFNEIKDLKPLVFRKLFENEVIFNEIVLTLFPKRTTLKLLHQYFLTKEEKIYQTLSEFLKNTI